MGRLPLEHHPLTVTQALIMLAAVTTSIAVISVVEYRARRRARALAAGANGRRRPDPDGWL